MPSNRRVISRAVVSVVIGILLLWAIFLAVNALLVVVGLPGGGSWGTGVWGTVERWASLGALWEGLGTLLLALGALVGAGWALYRYFEQRDRELQVRERQDDLDLARLQAALVGELRSRYEQARGQPEAAAVLDRLRQAEDSYMAILYGVMQLRPELAQAQRELITSVLDELTPP